MKGVHGNFAWLVILMAFGIGLGLAMVPVASAHAARLFFVSDTINDSRPGWPANHAIVFGVPQGVPASGNIVIAFENTPFSIDPWFSAADVSLGVSTSSPYTGFVNRPLGTSPAGASDGVSIAAPDGPITVTLSSGSGIPANAYVKILLGTGGYQITNPSSTASYRILLNTHDAGGASLDYGIAMVAILPAVAADVNQYRTTPPVLSNGMPTGTIPSNVNAVFISFNTDVYSTCRYATSSGVDYSAMTGVVTADSARTFQTFTVTDIVKGTTYAYYLRCRDFTGNTNASDYLISFTAGDPTGVPPGGGAPGSGGASGGGAPYPAAPLPPSLILRGIAVPNTSITVLEDGRAVGLGATSDNGGNFSVTIPSLAQGTYSFTFIENDGGGKALASYTTTMTVIAGTTNSITNLLLPPIVGFTTSTVAVNATAAIRGSAAPSSTIEVWAVSQSDLQGVIQATTTSDAAGSWSYDLDTAGWPIDTYQIKARASLAPYTASDFSNIAYLGVGTAPVARGKGDLNGDGKVNLVDFSIMLFHWGQNYPSADLNGDKVVDLPDFSILLFNWSG